MLSLLFSRESHTRTAGLRKYGAVLLIAAGVVSGTGCAKIAEPQPPEVHIPKPATDLSARQFSDSVVLRVSKPEQNTDGSPVTTLRSVEVFRLAGSENEGGQPLPAGQFIKQAAQVQSIPSSRFPDYLHDKTFVIQDRLQVPTSYSSSFRYAVVFVNNKNQAAGFSNQVLIKPIPIPPPPEGLSAEVTESYIKLQWVPPSENADGSKPARTAGYNVFRSEEAAKLPSTPINPAPVQKPEFEDRNFQFDKTYYYAVSTVGSLENPYAESLPSKAFSVTARDVFPPAPPKDFSAIREGTGVILLWAPSTSADVAGYRIYRQGRGGAGRQLLQKELITAFSYRDLSAEAGRNYEYSIQAVDTHGNESKEVRTEVETQ